MNDAPSDFYITGGTLSRDALSYVARQSDDDLYAALMRGEFCYILTPRQMGKSSLMAHTAQRLEEAGITAAILDLSAIGYELDADQWYNGLLDQLGRRLHLEDELEAFTLTHERLSPLQRWHQALRDVVLECISGSIVIFLDEIDIVRSLPFAVDEFFASIRACYNARTEDMAYRRMAFCLLGVATPAELIQNPRLTPFNIGRRIDLHDFSLEEAAQLQSGLGHDDATNRLLLKRICFWTGGHPYLTQCLCKAVATDGAILTEKGVDVCCQKLFLTPSSETRDDNLLFVQQRLLSEQEERVAAQCAGQGDGGDPYPRPEIEEKRAALLTLYRQVVVGKPVADNEATVLVNTLKLSGAVRAQNGFLEIRNRIYRQVFDSAWIAEHMPDAEQRRQRAAYWRGMKRAISISGLIAAAFGLLAFFAFNEVHIAHIALQREEQQKKQARMNLYVADMNVAQRAWENHDYARAIALVEQHSLESEDQDLLGFEWRYLWRLCHRYKASLKGHKGLIFCLAYSPDGQILASAGFDHTIRLWDTHSQQEVGRLEHPAEILSLAFSPDGRTLASGAQDGWVRFWDRTSRKLLTSLPGEHGSAQCLAYIPHGKMLVIGYEDGTLLQCDSAAPKLRSFLKGHGSRSVLALAFSSDGKMLAFGGSDLTIHLWNRDTRQETIISVGNKAITALAFSPEGKNLVSGDNEGSVTLWERGIHWKRTPLPGHEDWVNAIAFAPDGRAFATASWDSTARLWDAAGKSSFTLAGHTDRVSAVAFSPDGKTLASGSNDRTIKLWDSALLRQPSDTLNFKDVKAGVIALSQDGRLLAIAHAHDMDTVTVWDTVTMQPQNLSLKISGRTVTALAFTPNARRLAVGCMDGTVLLWEKNTNWSMRLLKAHVNFVAAIAISPDGQTLATGSYDETIKLWSVTTGKERTLLATGLGVIYAVAFSPDGKTLASASGSVITLWDTHTWQKHGTLNGAGDPAHRAHTNFIGGISFSPDGDLLASCGWDGKVVLWNLSLMRPQAEFRAHKGQVMEVAFAADGRTLVSGGSDGTMKLWNVSTHQEVALFKVHEDSLQYAAFSQVSGSSLLVTRSKEQVHLWRAASFAEIAEQEKRLLQAN